MTNEQVFLGGAPVVGFGDADISVGNPIIWKPLVGYLVGSSVGAVLGSFVKKGVGTAVGAIGGGLGGAVAGGAWVASDVRAALAARNESTSSGNPASKNCVEKGGRVETVTAGGGQSGVCVFPGGSRCEEWLFFRGECAPGNCYSESGKC